MPGRAAFATFRSGGVRFSYFACELGCDFDLDGFTHAAFYNSPQRRIEMLFDRSEKRVHIEIKDAEKGHGTRFRG